MFDISALKEMKLSELQEIAKLAKTIKYNGVKKDDLIAQIVEQQAKTSVADNSSEEVSTEKPKRTRIIPAKKGTASNPSSESIVDREVISNSKPKEEEKKPKDEIVKKEVKEEIKPKEEEKPIKKKRIIKKIWSHPKGCCRIHFKTCSDFGKIKIL